MAYKWHVFDVTQFIITRCGIWMIAHASYYWIGASIFQQECEPSFRKDQPTVIHDLMVSIQSGIFICALAILLRIFEIAYNTYKLHTTPRKSSKPWELNLPRIIFGSVGGCVVSSMILTWLRTTPSCIPYWYAVLYYGALSLPFDIAKTVNTQIKKQITSISEEPEAPSSTAEQKNK